MVRLVRREEIEAHRPPHHEAERAPRRDYARLAPAPRDPFFDKPYEAPAVAEAVADTAVAAGSSAASGLSPNIKPKRKVAALFKTT
jgi:hypothetical protein